jgi:prepilin-type N-terminal cleavage/methylation domain-containing protein
MKTSSRKLLTVFSLGRIIMKKKNKSAFTLIELLVVIAIIALLLAVILPSLRIAKLRATRLVCMTRQRGIIEAWRLYAEENDDMLVQSDTGGTPECWVQAPQLEDGTFSIATIEDRKRGCKRGAIYPYIKTVNFFHCPSDQRIKFRPESDTQCAFRSYSLVGGLNSWWASEENEYGSGSLWATDHISYIKLSQIKVASQSLCSVEEAETEEGYNQGSWAIFVTKDVWYDPLSIYHHDSSTFGFVDGHAGFRRWRDQRTIDFFGSGGKVGFTGMPTPGNEDLDWLQAHYPYEKVK